MDNKYRGYYKAVDASGNLITYNPGDVVSKNGINYLATATITGYSPEHGTRVGWVSFGDGSGGGGTGGGGTGPTGPSATGGYPYTYTSGLFPGIASADGEFVHNTTSGLVSIYMDDANGDSIKDTLTSIVSGQNSGQVRIVFGDTGIDRIFSYDSTSYSPDALQFTNTQIIPTGASGGSGKSVELFFVPGNPIMGASEHFRFPDGTTTTTIVKSVNGFTGDVNIYAGTGMTLSGTTLSAQPEYLMGFNFNGQGTVFGADVYTDTIRPVEKDSTATEFIFHSPNLSTLGTRVSFYKVSSSYVGASGASLEADKVEIGGSFTNWPSGSYGLTAAVGGTDNGLSAGDLVFVGINAAGLTDKFQLAMKYRGS